MTRLFFAVHDFDLHLLPAKGFGHLRIENILNCIVAIIKTRPINFLMKLSKSNESYADTNLSRLHHASTW